VGDEPVYTFPHMLTDRPTIVRAIAPRERFGDRCPTGWHSAAQRATPAAAMKRIVQARKRGSKPYLSLNIPEEHLG
jgi:hypothetical protein